MIDAVYRGNTFAPATTTIVLHGESGGGKTYFAEYIHQLSRRSGGFHAFSLGTVAPQLALDELFGHVPGAYTDARKVRTGRIAAAGSGTLLLDDMQTVDLGVQKQLLQVLDNRKYSPIGCDRMFTVACRIILAMTEEPAELMKKGLLLKDLRYRFGLCAIRIPPLRERREEIPLLAQRALERCPRDTEVEGPTQFSKGAIVLLQEGTWEGNVRELKAAVEYGFLMARMAGATEVGIEHLPADVRPVLRYQRHGDPEVNLIAVERALKITGGNLKAAAELLDISRTALNGFCASLPWIRAVGTTQVADAFGPRPAEPPITDNPIPRRLSPKRCPRGSTPFMLLSILHPRQKQPDAEYRAQAGEAANTRNCQR